MKKIAHIVLAIGAVSMLLGVYQINTPLQAAPLAGYCELVCPVDPCSERIQCCAICNQQTQQYCGQACIQDGAGVWRSLTYCDIYGSEVPCTSCF